MANRGAVPIAGLMETVLEKGIWPAVKVSTPNRWLGRTRTNSASYLHVIPQHQLLGIRMEVDLLVHPLRHQVAAQVML